MTALWFGFGAMCVGMFMAILDVQVVATSLPEIQGGLGIAPDQMSWVQTAYLIAEVIAIPLTGVLTRLLSMRWLFVLALLIFTLASIGCAASETFPVLIGFRVLQGFSGGPLIPTVFSAVFLLFPGRLQGIATTLAGMLAVLAPSVGPIVGGWITDTLSWHWLFLINVVPGIVSIIVAGALLPRTPWCPREIRRIDFIALMLLAIALAALEIALKEAPDRGWASPPVIGLLALCLMSVAGFVRRTLRADHPIIDLRDFADRSFAVGCVLSFVLGIGLFGSVYLMPVFLAYVRMHDALEIGTVMLVTGIAQLAAAPVAVALEQRVDPRLLTAAGFTLFAAGLAMSAFQTPRTDFHAMLWPQIMRGTAVMFCLLPPTRLALGNLPAFRVPGASGVFNLMRNLGGAIGLALIDTVIYGRTPVHVTEIVARLKAGDVETARFLGLSLEDFAARAAGPIDAGTRALLKPIVERGATTMAINEAWGMLAILTLLAMICVPFARRRTQAEEASLRAGTSAPSER